MTYDRKIKISAAGSRRAAVWPVQELFLFELWERLKTPARGTETQVEYLALKRSRQDDLKDVGGFVAGELKDGRRKSGNVLGRDLLTLDLDSIPAGGTEHILRAVDGLGCGYCVYSTRKHSPAAPRLRVLLPLDRTATADEYEPIARKAAQLMDPAMTPFDPSTFEASRLMYWPSCSTDGEYIFQWADKPLLSVDGILAQYPDWRDCAAWPQVPGVREAHQKLAAKQEDPTKKGGVLGAFCRTYDVLGAMEKFLPGVYAPTDQPDRFTFSGGTTTGGAVVYDNGLFLFSHHATDPAGGRLCNAFDLCRLHLYGGLDDDAKEGTPIGRLPSYSAMQKLAREDPVVSDLLNAERLQAVEADFSDLEQGELAPGSIEWMRDLEREETGRYKRSIKNMRIVMENHPKLSGRIRLNTFSERVVGIAPMPWPERQNCSGEFQWSERDDGGLQDFLERFLGYRSRDAVDVALQQTAAANRYDPVVDFLRSQEWDGTSRLDKLYIDYFGAEDCKYTRTVTRKAFCAAVARAMEPGIKFDVATVICGPQGIGKSTFFAKLGKEWFSNSVNTFEGKEAAELLQGVWIVEIGELEAFNRSDVRAVKQFLSRCDDQYRAAYARRVEKRLRKCIFFGTTNDKEYLKDPTGNRRFWPVDACVQAPVKKVWDDLTEYEVGQIWAEAYLRWELGEHLDLTPEMEAEADRRRELHQESDDLKGQIEEFLERSVPSDWAAWSMERRLMFWNGTIKGEDIQLVPRDRVCVPEVFRECLKDYRAVIPQRDSRRVAAVIASIEGWERAGVMRFGCEYGRQKGFQYLGNQRRQPTRGLTLLGQPGATEGAASVPDTVNA